VLPAGRSRVRFPMESLEFFSDSPSGRIVALGSTQPLNRNEYQESFLGSKDGRCVWLTNLPPSCADCLEILEPQPPGTARACPGFTFYIVVSAVPGLRAGQPRSRGALFGRGGFIKRPHWLWCPAFCLIQCLSGMSDLISGLVSALSTIEAHLACVECLRNTNNQCCLLVW
jgi:hypothetical protein